MFTASNLTAFDMGALAKDLPCSEVEVKDLSKLLDNPIIENVVIDHLIQVARMFKAEDLGMNGIDDGIWVRASEIDAGGLTRESMRDLEEWGCRKGD